MRGSAAATPANAVIAFESEESARRRLAAFGYPPEIAAEIAIYLAQSTDLPLFIDDITQALQREAITAEFVSLDELPRRLCDLAPQSDRTIVWAFTDGVRFYRGSSVPALARLEGFARFGSPAAAAHLCQDKFASLALASAAGLAVPPTRLMEGDKEIAALGGWASASGPLFVKPNTLGAKIGIFADSLCRDRSQALDRARLIWARYRDRALVQPFVEGDDVRVSFINLGGEFAAQLGVERIVKNAASEAGGAFLTMKDNETLSGARDTAGGRGGFGASRPAAFIPRMVDLRAEEDERSRRAVGFILDFSARLARLIGLRDLFSIDFRIDADGGPTFFEFEVCPGVTIYDFQNYLSRRGVTLGSALGRSMRLAFESTAAAGEA
jgi:D-alanine-D-alanine ligase